MYSSENIFLNCIFQVCIFQIGCGQVGFLVLSTSSAFKLDVIHWIMPNLDSMLKQRAIKGRSDETHKWEEIRLCHVSKKTPSQMHLAPWIAVQYAPDVVSDMPQICGYQRLPLDGAVIGTFKKYVCSLVRLIIANVA